MPICTAHGVEKKRVGTAGWFRCTSCYSERVQNWRRVNVYGRKIRRYDHLAKAGMATRFRPGHGYKGKNRLANGDAGYKLRLTERHFDELMEKQQGVCAICKRPPQKKRLCVDHDHKTGKVRGLLCFRCNYGLGWFQEDLQRIKNIVTYLEGT